MTVILMGILLLVECMLWGLGNPLLKIALESVTPLYCLMIRFFMGSILLLVIFGKRIIPALKKPSIKACLIVSVFTGGAFITANLGIAATTATNAGFLMSLAVLFVPFLSVFILKSHVRRIHYLWIAIVVLGLYLVCGNTGTFSFGLGEAMALLSSLCYAFVITLSERVLKDADPIALAFCQAAVTGVMCMIGAFIFEGELVGSAIQPEAWGVIIYLTIGCTCIAYILQNIALKYVPAGYASVIMCSEPIFTYTASYILLKETLGVGGMMGGALIIISIVAASITSDEKKQIST